MPSNKRKMQYLIEDHYYEKFKIIMQKEKRKSEGALSQFIIEKYIDEYEQNHGNIVIIGQDNNGQINM